MAYYISKPVVLNSPIVALAEAKEHLKIEADYLGEDGLVNVYIESAIGYIESYLGYAVQKQAYEVKGNTFSDVLSFSLDKIIEVSDVMYLDENGDTKTLPVDQYSLKTIDKFENRVQFVGGVPKVQENKVDVVSMSVVLGLKKVPKSIKQAVLLLVGDFYEFRSNRPQKTTNDTVSRLLSVLRKPC